MFASAGGLQSLLKEGSRHFSGLEEAISKNIDACKQLSTITRTSLGPHGLNKLVVNAHEKIFVTSDAATVMKEMDVVHPAAKLVVMAAKMQESEIGDGTNLVVILAGELLRLAEELISTGLHPSEIITGYEKAAARIESTLDDLVVYTASSTTDIAEVSRLISPVLASKIYGYEGTLSRCLAEAVGIVTEDGTKFDIENVRTAKLQGGSLSQSEVLRGLVVTRSPDGQVHQVTNAKVAVYNCPLDPQHSDTKGTVLISNATELVDYNLGEEQIASKLVRELVEAGISAVICGGSVAEMVLHHLNLANILVLKITSKFELRRVARVIGASCIVRLGAPTADETGFADSIAMEEISSHNVTIIKREGDCKVATIVLRANTTNMLDDSDRAIDDALNVYRIIRREKRFVVGGGGSEALIAKRLREYGLTEPGLEQYAILKYAQAFEIIPRTLSENAGLNPHDIISKLYAENSPVHSLDIEDGQVKDMSATLLDNIETKKWAVRLATEAALTVLRVDQIVMAKPSGGPKPDMAPRPEED
jgi:T-complex protein 1 subunit theta